MFSTLRTKRFIPHQEQKAIYFFVVRVSGNKESNTTESLKGSAPGATAPGIASPSEFLLRFQGAVVRLAISTTIKIIVSRKTINTTMKIFLFLFDSAMGYFILDPKSDDYFQHLPTLPHVLLDPGA